jgi:hypothetical protein
MKTTFLFAIAVLAVLAVSASAGPKLDALTAEVSSRGGILAGIGVSDPKVAEMKTAGLALLAQAHSLYDSAGDDNIMAAFAALGKGMAILEKSAVRAGPGAYAAAVTTAVQALWGAAIVVYSPAIGKVSDPNTVLATKLVSPTKLAGKGQYGKAVQKLAKVWPYLLAVEPNP